jgi:hypothetical protein
VKKYILLFSTLALFVTVHETACSKVGFNAEDSSSLQNAAGANGGTGNGDATGNLNQNGVTITNGTVTGVTVTGGTVGTNGTVTGGTITGGTITGGTINGGTNTGGTITGGTITGGTITGGTITGGTVGPGGTVTGGTLTGGTITGVTYTGGTVTPPPGATTTSDIPSVHFVGPPCHINTSCQAEFVLDKALAYPFSFHWRTNDSAYLLPPPSPGVIYGKPLVHYVPTSGDLVFLAGETSKSVYIQNINPDPTVAIVIQVIMSQCFYSSNTYACATVFH